MLLWPSCTVVQNHSFSLWKFNLTSPSTIILWIAANLPFQKVYQLYCPYTLGCQFPTFSKEFHSAGIDVFFSIMSSPAVRRFSTDSSVHFHVPTRHSTVMSPETVICNAVLSLRMLKPLAEESWFGEGRFFVLFKSISSWAHKAKVTLCLFTRDLTER